MAVDRIANITQAREAIGIVRTETGEVIDVVATREFYRFLSELARLVISSRGPLSETEDEIPVIVAAVNQNANDIADNATNIAQNASDLSDHEALTIAHGSNGDVVGKLDLATLLDAGLVTQAADVGLAVGFTDPVAQAWANSLRANLQAAGIMA